LPSINCDLGLILQMWLFHEESSEGEGEFQALEEEGLLAVVYGNHF
jgi:hypothetical protein